MIKCDKGNVCISGSKTMVLAELSTLVHSMCYGVLIGDREMNPADARSEILDAVEYGFMTEDEAKAKASDMREDVGDIIEGVISMPENLVKGREH